MPSETSTFSWYVFLIQVDSTIVVGMWAGVRQQHPLKPDLGKLYTW